VDVNSNSLRDVIIVGGGVSGLYTAWRLLTGKAQTDNPGPITKVTVLELSKRTGGRLLTWRPFTNNSSLHAELGGMRFFEQQELVWSLIQYFVGRNQLQPPIKFFVGDPNHNNLTYLRQRILKSPDLSNPQKVPYLLDASSRYAGPGDIAAGIIQTVLIANRGTIAKILGGKTQPTTWREWDEVKPYLEYGSRKLWDIGFWNLLSDLLSPEGYDFVTDGFGYYSLTNNWNAAEAMQSVYLDFTQSPDYQTLVEGYDYLPGLLKQEVKKAGGEVRLEHAVMKIDRESDGTYTLQIRNTEPMRSKSVVLAMPRRSLELLDETPFWNWEKAVSGTAAPGRLVDYLQSVIPYPAFKLFLAYDVPWWRKPPVSIAAGRSVSDLPIRQTYYFPPVKDSFPPIEDPTSPLLKGPGLVMASYDDLGAVSFWKSLEDPRDLRPQIRSRLKLTVKALYQEAEAGLNPYENHVMEMGRALADEPGFLPAPAEMVRHAQQQLRYLHFNQPLPDPMQDPHGQPGEFLAAYKDWSHDPYGGGWNFWAAGVNVRKAMQGIRRPFPHENLFIVGEAYSGSQGWVEGALTTAEHVLRDYFHLQPEPWQPSSAYLGY
jgi:monoamine oxidase